MACLLCTSFTTCSNIGHWPSSTTLQGKAEKTRVLPFVFATDARRKCVWWKFVLGALVILLGLQRLNWCWKTPSTISAPRPDSASAPGTVETKLFKIPCLSESFCSQLLSATQKSSNISSAANLLFAQRWGRPLCSGEHFCLARCQGLDLHKPRTTTSPCEATPLSMAIAILLSHNNHSHSPFPGWGRITAELWPSR